MSKKNLNQKYLGSDLVIISHANNPFSMAAWNPPVYIHHI
jgi:hypothetical protein